jgi:hypothetical protein
MRGQVHDLELVYPPVSNQEAEWIKDDPEVQSAIAYSNIYFIGQKRETFFKFPNDLESRLKTEGKLHFSYKSGTATGSGYIDIQELLLHHKLADSITLDIDLGDKFIRIWTMKAGVRDEVIEWFTTDKILVDRSHGLKHIKGLDNYKEFLVFILHYVGISKKDDSLQRLVVKPHDKRLRILSNEHPLNPGSRLTDEMVLFFFRITSLEIKQYITPDDFNELGENELQDRIRITADAEKAFVKIMNTQYNEVKFQDYPFSTDGLFNSKVERIGYSINEDLQFITDTATIRGARKYFPGAVEGDFIAVSKDKVELIKVELPPNE